MILKRLLCNRAEISHIYSIHFFPLIRPELGCSTLVNKCVFSHEITAKIGILQTNENSRNLPYNALVYNHYDKMLFVYVVYSCCQLFIFVTVLSRG